MKKFAILASAAIVGVTLLGMSGGASAQATRTWVSGVGDDVNPCSRTAPCKTFAGAISKTATGGEINCLDSAGYGAVTVTKSITISCGDVEASILASSTTGVIVNGAGIHVILRGLKINGGTPAAPGINGVRFLQGSSLTVENCTIFNFNGATPNGNGILVDLTNGISELFVRNTVLSNNGSGNDGAGIQIRPNGNASIRASIDGVGALNNFIGIRGDARSTTGTLDISVSNSTISGSTTNGVVALSIPGTTRIYFFNSASVVNSSEGLRSVGGSSTIQVGSSLVSGNALGLSQVTGGNIVSYGNNQNQLNTNNGAFSATTPLQ